MNRLEEALSANEPAVDLYRSLTLEIPAPSNGDLALLLNNLLVSLSDLRVECQEEALSAIEQAAELYRSLA